MFDRKTMDEVRRYCEYAQHDTCYYDCSFKAECDEYRYIYGCTPGEMNRTDFFCEFCDIETKRLCGFINVHITGEPKDVSTRKCPSCNRSYLFVHIRSHSDDEKKGVLYRILLDEKEAGNLSSAIKRCPRNTERYCNCLEHEVINRFESKNSERIVVIGEPDIDW